MKKGVIYRTGEQVSKNARPKGNTPSHLYVKANPFPLPLFGPGPPSPGVHLLCVPWPGPASLSPRHANALEGNQLLNIPVGAFPFQTLRNSCGCTVEEALIGT